MAQAKAKEAKIQEEQNVVLKVRGKEIPEGIESFLIGKLGLSSTGSLQVIGNYLLTHDSKLGVKSDKVMHIIQQDLLGGRLFWSCLVNVTQSKVQILYRCQAPDKFGTITTIDKEDS